MSTTTLNAFYGPALLKSSPWSLFDQAWTSVMGYPAAEFRFTPGVTPMATWTETLLMISLYYLTIYTAWELMKKREPFKLKTLFKVHNFILTAVSGALLVLFLEQLVPALWKHGLYNCMCSSPGWTDKLVVLYYVSTSNTRDFTCPRTNILFQLNYLTKYVELLDTVFLVVKKKPLSE
jgi:fatty acid elongase 3